MVFDSFAGAMLLSCSPCVHRPCSLVSWRCRTRRVHVCRHGGFFSSMADVALWLGPYMSISSKNFICTRTEKARKCRQITTNQPSHRRLSRHGGGCQRIKERLTELARAVSNTSSPAGMPSGSVSEPKRKSGLCWQHARQNYMPGS